MNVKRVTTLVKFMRALPRSANKHFDMRKWIAHDAGGHSHDFQTFIRPKDLASCGTTACALGWAAAVPAFRRAGLRVEAVPMDLHCNTEISNSARARAFFDLTTLEFRIIFGGYNDDATPKKWAARVERFVKQSAPQ